MRQGWPSPTVFGEPIVESVGAQTSAHYCPQCSQVAIAEQQVDRSPVERIRQNRH